MSSVIPGDVVDALWDLFTTGKTNGLIRQLRAASNDEALAVLDVSEVEVGPVSPATGAKYFEVKLESRGHIYHVPIEARDRMHAGNLPMWRDPSANSAQVVREIDRAEFERLTHGAL